MELPASRKLYVSAILICLSGVSGCAQGSGDSYGQQFGAVTIAAGQTQQVWTGVAYRLLRVCNNFESSGTAVVVIDDRQPATLGPGICTEDYGNRIEMKNQSAQDAKITYRAIPDAVLLR
jgi:hypothetical protein